MKVAMVGPYPRAAADGTHADHSLGGVAAYTKNLVDGMRRATDARIVVAAPSDAPGAPRIDGEDAPVHVHEFPRTAAGAARAMRELAEDDELDLVHVQFEQHLYGGPLENLRLALSLRRLARRKRVAVTVHQVPDLAEVDRDFLRRNGFPPIPFLARLWMRLQYALLATAAHLLLVHETRLRDLLVVRYGVKPAKVTVVPHGIDAGVAPCGAAEAKRRLGLEGRDVVLYFGYVTGYKGVDLLAEALAKVPEARRGKLAVVIAGKVPERKMENAAFRAEVESLEARIAALAPFVQRKGFLREDEIALHLAAADVVVFPYRNVFGASGPLSITLGHARPFLASAAFRGMGVPEAALFPIEADALCARLLRYFDEPRLRVELEAEARRLAHERSWPAVAQATVEAYGRVLPAEPAAPRVLLMGAYGQDNLGDEALLEVHLQQLAGMRVVVGSSNPLQTRARYGVPAVHTYGGLRTIRAFLESDAVVFGGGSVVKELPRPYPRQRVLTSLAVLSTVAHGLGRGVAYSAVGVEKIEHATSRALVRRAARASDIFAVRDEGSRRLLAKLGMGERATVVADAAYLLRTDDAAERRADDLCAPAGGKPVIVINPIASHEVRRERSEVVASFVALIEEIHARTDAHVLLFPFKTSGDDSDTGVSAEILARVRRHDRVGVVPADLRPAEALAVLSRARFAVGMRHHAVLLSLVARTPVLAIPYAPKTDHLVDEFGLRGSTLPAELLSERNLTRAFWHAYEGRFAQRAPVERALAEMQERAQANFDALRSFLRARGPA